MASLREVGQRLKLAREAQGLTLDDVAARTRITIRHLLALEEGNETDLPETFYIRGFLKKYAEAVGLAPNDVADAYKAAPVPASPQAEFRPSFFGPAVYYLAIIGLLGGAAALAWHFQPRVSVVDGSPSPSPTVAPSPTPSPAPTATPSPAPTATATAAPSPSPTQTSVSVQPDPSGQPSAASGLRLRLPDLARIGQLLLQQGEWDGRTVVPRAWLTESLAPRLPAWDGLKYGYQWFIAQNADGSPVWVAIGLGGQRLVVAPSLQMVYALTMGNYTRADQVQRTLAVQRLIHAAVR